MSASLSGRRPADHVTTLSADVVPCSWILPLSRCGRRSGRRPASPRTLTADLASAAVAVSATRIGIDRRRPERGTGSQNARENQLARVAPHGSGTRFSGGDASRLLVLLGQVDLDVG